MKSTKTKKGYLNIRLSNQETKLVHRLIYELSHKVILDPKEDTINHIDGNPENNALYNLEVVSRYENNRRKLPEKDFSVNYHGVRKVGMLYEAYIKAIFKGEIIVVELGFFLAAFDAAKKYDEAITNINNQNNGGIVMNFPVPRYIYIDLEKSEFN